MLVVLPGERARGQDLVGERDEEDAERRRHERERRRRAAASARRGGAGPTGSGRRPRPRGSAKSSAHESAIAPTTTISAAGSSAAKRRSASSTAERDDADGERGAAHVAELAHHLPELRQRLASRRSTSPSSLPSWPITSDDGDAVDVADQHRPGEVVGDPAEPQQPREQEAGRDEQREHRRQLGRVVGCRRRRAGAPPRRRASRPSPPGRHQLARRAEQHVRDRRQQQRVEAVDRREPGDLGVGHRRRQRERRDRQPGDEVAAGARHPVARHVLRTGPRARAAAPASRAGTPRSPVRGPAVLRRGLSGWLVVCGHGPAGRRARAA